MQYIQISALALADADGQFVQLPLPKHGGISVIIEQVWSRDYGINARGHRIGTLLLTRNRYSITFPQITRTEMHTLASLAGLGFSVLRYTDLAGVITEMPVEITGLAGQERSWARGQQWIDNATITLTER